MTLIITYLNCPIAKDCLEDGGGEEGEDGQDNRKGGCNRDFKMIYSVICIGGNSDYTYFWWHLQGDVNDSYLSNNNNDGAVHGDAAADDDNDDHDDDDADDDHNDNEDGDVEQTHGISSFRRKLAILFVVSQRTLGHPITPYQGYWEDNEDGWWW